MKRRKPVAAVAFIVSLLCSQSSRSAGSDEWSLWVEQDGQRFEPGKALVLARKPFTISFRGPPGNDYGVAATSALEELPRSGDLSPVFRVSNGLLVDDPNTKISISGAGVIKKGWSSWNLWAYHAPTEVGLKSGFQARTANQDGTVTLARTIDTLCVDDGQRDVCKPVASAPFAIFHAVVARIPHLRAGQSIQDTRWLDPRVISIEFR